VRELESIFDQIIWSPVEGLDPDYLKQQIGGEPRFDIVDLQFHQSAIYAEEYKKIAGKLLFTPMESLARFLFIDVVRTFKKPLASHARPILSGIKQVVEEIKFSRSVDQVVCVSRTDARLLSIVSFPSNVDYLETGVSEIELGSFESFGGRDPFKLESKVLFVAYFGSQTNVDALRWYLQNVHPIICRVLPNYIFQVVGRGDLSSFACELGPNFSIVGEVERISPYIESAKVGISPAISGSGLRGKINQYAAFGLPCVASPIAASGLSYKNEQDILIADDPAEFAQAVIRLLSDSDFNSRIGKSAKSTCLKNYSWQSKWPHVQRIYGLRAGDR
jgi:glycosyltransferase involved in cell wall biosynthesis